MKEPQDYIDEAREKGDSLKSPFGMSIDKKYKINMYHAMIASGVQLTREEMIDRLMTFKSLELYHD